MRCVYRLARPQRTGRGKERQWLIKGTDPAGALVPFRWINNNVKQRIVFSILLCLFLSADVFLSSTRPASQPKFSEISDQLKRGFSRKATDSLAPFGSLATTLGLGELAIRSYSLALVSAAAGYGPDSAVTAKILMQRAGVLSHFGRLEEALRDENQVVRVRPADHLVYESRGIILWRLKRYFEAAQDFETSLQLNPNSASAAISYAIMLRRVNRLQDARIAYGRAIENISKAAAPLPLQATVYSMRGQVSHELGEFQTAIDDYTYAINAQASALIYLKRALSYHELKMYDAAISDHSHAIELDAERFDAFFGRGNSYLALGRYEAALADFTHLVEGGQAHTGVYVNRAIVYGKLERADRALADFREAIRLDPDHFNAYRNRGWLYEQIGRLELARSDYERAIELSPSDPWLGRATARLGLRNQRGDANE
jgi:tetratricopeptide (TPR) repeat protein